MFCDYQVNLGNTANLNSTLYEGKIFYISGKGGEPYMGGIDNSLETMLYYRTLVSL